MLHFLPIKEYEGKYCVNISSLFPPLFMYTTKVQFVLSANSSFDYELVVIYEFYDTDTRKYMIEHGSTLDITQYSSTCCDNVLGIYIEMKQRLSTFELCFNGYKIFKLDEWMLDMFGSLCSKRKIWTKKHSLVTRIVLTKRYIPHEIIDIIENYCNEGERFLYYFPYSIYPFNDTFACNMTKIDELNIVCKHKDQDCDHNIYFKQKNKLIFKDGTISLEH
jgi:hypothetical protein